MSLIRPALTKINEKETLRYAGMKDGANFPQEIIDAALKEVLVYASPIGIWQMYDYSAPYILDENNNAYDPQSANLLRHLKGSHKVCMLALTIGEAVEERVTALFKQGEYAKAILTDAAATAATEQVADSICEYIINSVKGKGFIVGRRFSPGYGDWDIKEQPTVLKLANADKINLTVTSSLMLTPRKSVTAIVGLIQATGDSTETITTKNCDNCDKTDCSMRRN